MNPRGAGATVVALAALALVLVGRSTPARAESYRDELLIADTSVFATAAALSLVGVKGEPVRYAPGVAFLLASPAVHVSHGNPGRAFGALALRGGSVVTTVATLRWCLDRGDQGGKIAGCVLGSLALGAVLMGGAIAIDYAVLAAGDDDDPAPVQLGWSGTF